MMGTVGILDKHGTVFHQRERHLVMDVHGIGLHQHHGIGALTMHRHHPYSQGQQSQSHCFPNRPHVSSS